jgi:hypothetical protein
MKLLELICSLRVSGTVRRAIRGRVPVAVRASTPPLADVAPFGYFPPVARHQHIPSHTISIRWQCRSGDHGFYHDSRRVHHILGAVAMLPG